MTKRGYGRWSQVAHGLSVPVGHKSCWVHRILKLCVHWQVVFLPLKLYDNFKSRSRGLLELGEHDRVPAQAVTFYLLLS